jgi:hypothetical protein
MDRAKKRFPYRCLPLVMANQYGWEILCTNHFRARWHGTPKRASVDITNLGHDSLSCHSYFGEGVLTFEIPFLFQTPNGWNLMVRGPTNNPKDGIAALDGIVETDWAHSTFTMNWRFTRPCTVEFVVGEPICLFFPIQRGALERFRGEFRRLQSNPEIQAKFQEWSASRNRLIWQINKAPPNSAVRWSNEYMRTANDKKPFAHEFVKKMPSTNRKIRTEPPQSVRP